MRFKVQLTHKGCEPLHEAKVHTQHDVNRLKSNLIITISLKLIIVMIANTFA